MKTKTVGKQRTDERCIDSDREVNLNGQARDTLLVGDAPYAMLRVSIFMSTAAYMVGTHHGGKFSGRLPLRVPNLGTCVFSVGKGNNYKHPRREIIATQSRRAGIFFTRGRRRREARRQISALAAGHLPIAIARCPEEVRGEYRPSLRSGKAQKPTPPRQQRPHGIVIDLNGPCSSGHPLLIPAPASACAASQNFPSCPR